MLTLALEAAFAAVDPSLDQAVYSCASYDLAGKLTPTADNGSTPYWTATTTFPEPSPNESLYLNGVMVGAYGWGASRLAETSGCGN